MWWITKLLKDDKFRKLTARLKDVNPAWTHLFGFSRDETIGKTSIEIGLDINDQKLAEQTIKCSETKFRRIFDLNIVGLVFWKHGGKIVEANAEFLRTFGYSKEDLHKEIQLLTSVSPDLSSLLFKSDPGRLRQIITNLTRNMNDYVTKPIKPQLLAIVVERTLRIVRKAA